MLWKWAKRRHPNKSQKWIANKYWKQSNTRRWNFQTENNELLLLSATRIQRYIPLKLQMNPFLDYDYFHERQNKLMFRKKKCHKKKQLLPNTERVIECLSGMT
jgi:RNA-directed DNA polymerase